MGTYILRRLVIFIPMVLGITLITFAFATLTPGDPVDAMVPLQLQMELHPDDLERLREKLGLNKPIIVRYFIWLGQLAQGDFGYSLRTNRPVLWEIGQRILPTLELTSTSFVLSTVFGLLFGVIAAIRQYSVYDYALSILSLLGLSIPTFFFALGALFIFASYWEIFPVRGMSSLDGNFTVWDNIYHLILPATVLSIDSTSGNTRYARTAMLEVMNSDYITTARAKGLSEYVVIARHAFRNTLLPIITITTLRLPFLFGGAVIIEAMFSWPGMGMISIQAMRQRDYPLLMGLTFFIGLLILSANLIADILYAYADPRIREGREAT